MKHTYWWIDDDGYVAAGSGDDYITIGTIEEIHSKIDKLEAVNAELLGALEAAKGESVGSQKIDPLGLYRTDWQNYFGH